MKISHLTLGILILSASMSQAQQDKHAIKPKQESIKIKTKEKPLQNNKPIAKDSTKIKTVKTPRYCGPCGMG